MTDYKQLCAGLIDALDSGISTEMIRKSPLADRARAALAEPEPEGPTPIPMAERLPCLEDCDEQGRCWFHSTGRAWCDWYLLKASSATDTETHWLPANALPTPEVTND